MSNRTRQVSNCALSGDSSVKWHRTRILDWPWLSWLWVFHCQSRIPVRLSGSNAANGRSNWAMVSWRSVEWNPTLVLKQFWDSRLHRSWRWKSGRLLTTPPIKIIGIPVFWVFKLCWSFLLPTLCFLVPDFTLCLRRCRNRLRRWASSAPLSWLRNWPSPKSPLRWAGILPHLAICGFKRVQFLPRSDSGALSSLY